MNYIQLRKNYEECKIGSVGVKVSTSPFHGGDRGALPLPSTTNIAGWSSWSARWVHIPKVTGSNPVPATLRGGVMCLITSLNQELV